MDPEKVGKDWRAVLEPLVARYQGRRLRRCFRADAAFANPEIYEYLGAAGFEYAIRLPGNDALLRDIEPLLTRPVGKTIKTTEEVSSHPGEKKHRSPKRHRNIPGARCCGQECPRAPGRSRKGGLI
jgi:hypothetical protein